MSADTHNIVGEVNEIRRVPNPKNFNRTTITKMVIKDKNGEYYTGTKPATIKVEEGDRITFTAEARRVNDNNFLFKGARNAVVTP